MKEADADHTRGLCQQPDVAPDTPRFLARGRARCACCGSIMVDEDCDSASMDQLGMYWLRCPVCPAAKATP